MPLTFIPVIAALALDPTIAARQLQEAASWCEADGKRIWGRTLCGPVLIVDPATREYTASDGAKGTIPAGLPIANTALIWQNQKTTMVLWPLPDDEATRKSLFAHELWHRIQEDLGFPSTGPANSHLDEVDGRVWLRLEARALKRALMASDTPSRKAALSDAIQLRARRHGIFRQAAEEERSLEMHEGLAEYTGVAASGAPTRLAIEGLTRFESGGTFVRNFAYGTTPAYGVLIDAASAENWRAGLKPTDSLPALAARVYGAITTGGDAFDSASRYDDGTVRQQELLRSSEHLARIKRLRALFVDSPVLVLAAENQLNFSFNPNAQVPLDGLGTVYTGMQVSDSWGSMTTSKEALITSDYRRVLVPKPDSSGLSGDGWTLQLKPGWRVVPGKRAADKTVVKVLPVK